MPTNQINQTFLKSQSSLVCNIVNGNYDEISDDEVNAAYNYFSFEQLRYYNVNHPFVSTNRNFRSNKTKHPLEWQDFVSVVKLCHDNKFHLRCYIKYCFYNKLVPKARGKKLSDIAFLRNYPQMSEYASQKSRIERLFKIFMSIQRSILLVKNICKKTSCEPKDAIKKLISSGKLIEYVSTSVLSPFFISLIPKASLIIHKFADRENEDLTVLVDLCNRIDRISNDAFESIKMFDPSSMSKTVIELCK